MNNFELIVRNTRNSYIRFHSLLLACTVYLAGCATDPNSLAMQVGAPPANALELRTLQTRQMQTKSAVEVMHAATQVMQDLGFTVKESSADVGVLVGTKSRDAEEAGEVAGAVALSLLGAVAGVYVEPVWDTDQEINMTLVQYPTANSDGWDVRVSFDRTITNSKKQQRAELIMDPKIYQDFFKKLEQGVFLEQSK